MKRILISIFYTMMFWQVIADEAKPSNSEPTACNAQMSIQLKEVGKEIRTNQPVQLTIHIKNTSTNEIFYFQIYSLPTDFSWDLTSPSGKKLFFKESSAVEGFSSVAVQLKPNQTEEYQFNLSLVCSLNEIGTYKVFAEKEIVSSVGRKKCEVISNTLSIVVTK